MYRIRKKERNDRLFLSRYPYMDIKTYNDIRATRHDATSMILLQNSLSLIAQEYPHWRQVCIDTRREIQI